MRALSFLGTGKYEETTYLWREEKACTTHLFPKALVCIFGVKELLLLVTPKAKESNHFSTLRERLGNILKPLDIPEGRSEEELWQIFDLCTGAVKEGEEVILDITHAFRSLPVVVFTVASYLRRVKRVTLRALVYGAYEARDEENRSPIFDLTPLVDLLDWTQGVETLIQRSDAAVLAQKLRETHTRLWKKRDGGDLPRKLQGLSDRLQAFSQALHLSRPLDVMREAKRLSSLLEEALPEVEKWAKPFRTILEELRGEVTPLAYALPERLDRENLSCQLKLIEHYLEKGFLVQAATLAREWVVSWAVLQKGEGDWLGREERERAERDLGAAAEASRKKETGGLTFQEAGPIWGWLGDLRNDLAHCGMKPNPASASSLEGRAREIPEKLRSLLSGTPSHTLQGGQVVVDLRSFYGETAKVEDLPLYVERAKEMAGEGREVVLTGQAPIWMYLALAHALHGRARRLLYTSPASGEVLIFDHSVR